MNGRAIFELSPQLRSDLVTSFSTSEEGNSVVILSVIARTEYNGTTVQCLINGGFSGQSENVTLSVQGILHKLCILEWEPGCASSRTLSLSHSLLSQVHCQQ